MDEIKATTDGEKIVQLSGQISNLDNKLVEVCKSIDRAATAIENLEKTRIADLEARLYKIEKWQSEWIGMYKLVSGISLILGIGAIIVSIYLKYSSK